MKFTGTAFIVLFFLCLSLSSAPSFAEVVENIDDLVLLDDVVQCKNCHKEHGSQWPKSAHSGSVSDFRTLKAFKRYMEFYQESLLKGNPGIRLRDNCFTCHAPRAKNASESLLNDISGLIVTAVNDQGSLRGQSALKELSKISIDCCVCHMINGMPEGEAEPNVLYGPGWDEHELSHTRDHGFDTVGSAYLMSSKMCTGCHSDWLAGVPSIVQRMHKNSQSHFLEAEKNSMTCQSCHMMDGDMIIHTMPIYSGTLNFPIEKTADKIGTVMAFMTVLGICISAMSKAYSKRKERKRAMGGERCESFEIMPAFNAAEFYPCEADAAIDKQKNIDSARSTGS